MNAQPKPTDAEHGEDDERDRGDAEAAGGQHEVVGAVRARLPRQAAAAARLEIGHAAEGYPSGLTGRRRSGGIPVDAQVRRLRPRDRRGHARGARRRPEHPPRPVPSSVPADGWSERSRPRPREPAAASPVRRRSEVPIAPPPQPQGRSRARSRSPGRSRWPGGRRRRATGMRRPGLPDRARSCWPSSSRRRSSPSSRSSATRRTRSTPSATALEDGAGRDHRHGAAGRGGAPPPTGIAGRSMIRPANLAKAIEVLRQQTADLGRTSRCGPTA